MGKGNSGFELLKKFGSFNLLLSSVVTACFGQYLIYFQKNIIFGPVIFLLSILLFCAAEAAYSYGKPGKPAFKFELSDKKVFSLRELAVFLIILAVAVMFRFYMIGSLPEGAHRDEADAVVNAMNIIRAIKSPAGDSAVPFYFEGLSDNPAMREYIISAVFKFAGAGITQARAAMALMGVLTVAAFYFLLRYLFGQWPAAAGSALLAFSGWHVMFGRFLFHGGLAVFFMALVLYFAYRAYYGGKLQDFMLLGLLAALSQYSYHAAKGIPFALAACGIYILVSTPGFYRENQKKILVCAAAFLAGFLPFIIYMTHHPDSYFGRPAKLLVSVNAPSGPAAALKLYAENSKKMWLMFNYEGDKRPEFNPAGKPMLDVVTGVFAAMGFGFVLGGLFCGSAFSFLTLIMFAAFMQMAAVFEGAPHAARSIMVLLFALMFCVVFAARAYAYLREQCGKRAGPISTVLAVFILSAAGCLNFRAVFIESMREQGMWQAFDVTSYRMAKYLKIKGGVVQAVLPVGTLKSWASREFEAVFAGKEKNYRGLDAGEDLSPASGNKKKIFVLTPDYMSLVPLLRKLFPLGAYEVVNENSTNEKPAFFIYSCGTKNTGSPVLSNGLTAKYHEGGSVAGRVIMEKPEPVVAATNMGDKDAYVVYSGSLKTGSAGVYRLTVKAYMYYKLAIDGKKVLETSAGPDNRDYADIYMEKGMHKIVLEYLAKPGCFLGLFWTPPGSVSAELVPNEALYFRR
jgi:hypothetical protein